MRWQTWDYWEPYVGFMGGFAFITFSVIVGIKVWDHFHHE